MGKIYALLAVFILLLVALSVFPSYELQTITNDNCTTIIVGKDASATGSILVAHNEDDSGNIEISLEIEERNAFPGSVNLTDGTGVCREERTMLALPLPEKSYAYAWSHMEGQDFSDSYINENGVFICSDGCPSKEDKPDLTYGGIRYYLRRWVADPSEAWVLHAVYGKHWVAQSVPDDSVVVISNCYVINEVDLRDSKNFLGSKEIMNYAKERGWRRAV